MTEKQLSEFGLLDEFSITELEQRLEFEAWCDWNCGCGSTSTNTTCQPNTGCVPVNSACGGGGGGGGERTCRTNYAFTINNHNPGLPLPS